MTTPSIKQLRDHRNRIQNCNTFEAFKEVQWDFINLLIELMEKDEEELRECARTLLQEKVD